MTDVKLNGQAHQRVAALVEEGMERQVGACPGRWPLAKALPMPNGGMFFSGWCASAAELQADENGPKVRI
jgi:hypothetical protein